MYEITKEDIEAIRGKVKQWQEKKEKLESILKEVSTGKRKLELKTDRDSKIKYIEMAEKTSMFKKRKKELIAIVIYDDLTLSMTFHTNQEYMPILKEICDSYDKKNLKDKPDIVLS